MDGIARGKGLGRQRRVALRIADSALRREVTGVLPFLFAVRWGAWAVAEVIVVFGDLPHENTEHEPLLLAGTFAQILVGTLYVPLLRSPVRKRLGMRAGPRDDLIILSLLDVALALAVVYWSGGWGTPYYHYAVASLLVPTYLLGWRRSTLLVLAFLAAYVGILSTAGAGTDGPWLHEDVSSLAGVLMTPVLVVAVMQYLSQLMRRLEQQREEAQRAFNETAALYSVAQAVAADDAVDHLAGHVVDILKGMERFKGAQVFSLQGERELVAEGGFDSEKATASGLALSDSEIQALSQPEALVELGTADGLAGRLFAVPVHMQDRLWGAVAFRTESEQPQPSDSRLMRAVAGQLSLGMTKISLNRQKEELAAQEERSRIAREIHDGIAQSIYMLSLNLEKAAETASGDDRLGQRLRKLVGLAKETLLEVRHYIFDLKPLLSGEAGLISTIQAQLQEFSTVSGLPVELTVEGDERKVPLAVGSCLYRIAQEALANAYRHADATSIQAKLAFETDAVSLEIRDNGCGFAIDPARPATSGGRGLRNIQQRASELGGRVDISSAPGHGTTVGVTLPVAR
jgi:signal transduction histidine kinase